MASGYSFWEAVTNPGELEKALKLHPDYNPTNPGGSRYSATPAPTAAIPTADYSAFRMTPEEQGRRAAGPAAVKARADDQAATTRANSYTPAERQMLAISPNPYGTNEPYFDNAGIKRAGYDRMQMNTYDPKVAQGLPGMNPATGVGGSGVGAALQAAAARGDWDAVGRYYASQGQTFGGKMYGDNQDADLYNRAFGSGIKSVKGRNRAAEMLTARERNQALLGMTGMQGENARALQEQRQAWETPYKEAETEANMYKVATMIKALKQKNSALTAKNLVDLVKSDWYIRLPKEEQAAIREQLDPLLGMQQIEGNANGGLVEGYARGGQVQPVLNPMGNMGMPSSMADLDPAIRQYAQYVSTASQYGLQPVAFPKFIDLLGAARTKLATLPTQGGATGFADGGKVEEDNMYYVKQYDEQGGFTGYKAYPRSEMPKDDSGRPYWVPQEEWKKNTPSDNQYAGGGAIPVAGRQVLGPGGPKSDSIPAVINGSRPAALSDGEFVMPTEAVQFYGTDKLNKMIQKARGQ